MKKDIIQKISLVVFLVAAFFIMMLVWYAPVVFKGYPAEQMSQEIVLARNYAQTGLYAMENKLNVVVAPELVKSQAETSSLGNKFNSISYAAFFKFFGWQDWNKLALISSLVYALGGIIFTIVVLYLFGPQAALIFPFVYTLLPFNGHIVQFIGTYEFSILYFSVFTLLFFWGRDKKIKILYLFLAGIFLSLSCLARESIMLFLPVFFIWLLFYKKKKELLLVFIPLAVILFIFWLPSVFGINSSNDYIKMFTATDNTNQEYSDFHFYGHIYPDPYSFHFDKLSVDRQLEASINNTNSSLIYRVGRLKVGANMGIVRISFWERLMVGTNNLIKHVSRFFAFEYVGGPFIFLLAMLGAWSLKKEKKELYHFFLFWFTVVPLILAYVALVNRNHLMDFGWAIAALVAVGLATLLQLLKKYYNLNKTSQAVYVFIILMTLYNLVLATHVSWGRTYDQTNNLEIKYLADKVNSFNEKIIADDVIAVGDRELHPTLNYLTSRSVVFFDPNTIKKLLEDQKLQSVFDEFGVKFIVGFNEEVSDLITKNSKVKNIAVWPDKKDIEIPLGDTKSWILNLVK